MDSTNSSLGNTTQQLQLYKQVLDVMPAGVILLDAMGLVAKANPEAYRLLGKPLEKQRWLDVIARAFSPQDDDGHEVSLQDGKRVKLAISASASGQLILITDMTQTRLLQSRISSLQRFSSLGKMVASLAHQLRTPLSAALLYAANLCSTKLTQTTKQKFQIKLVERLHDLEKQVNDMLLFAKGGDNKVANLFSLEQLLNEFEPMIESIVIHQNVDFSICCDDESLMISGNVNALASALSNLVINAIQAAGKGCEVKLISKVQKEQILLSVIDNGPGICAKLKTQIFEPFFTTKEQGTGLGLSVVQMVCHAHNGKLTMHSLPDGTCFTLYLPLALSKITATQPQEISNESM